METKSSPRTGSLPVIFSTAGGFLVWVALRHGRGVASKGRSGNPAVDETTDYETTDPTKHKNRNVFVRNDGIGKADEHPK